MTPPPSKLAELFDAALDVPDEDRSTWLVEVCGTNEELLSRLRLLLRADASNVDGLLDTPILSRSSEQMPKAVGSYLPIRLLGEGGMGVLYGATQQTTGREVALKLIRAGLATPRGMRRFQQEAEILAKLNHEGIAHVYDAGTAPTTYADGTDARRLFIAMELVQGKRITEYAVEKGLSVNAKLELIEKLAHAVQYAHQHRVIHRDLKPSNILVDQEGRPKLVDFGIARLADATDAGRPTVTSHIVGTAQYMSPEQATGGALDIDARTDIYSLGAVLYELLAGRPPLDVTGLTAIAAARRVAEEEPARLTSLVPALRGDIDAIVHKAIARDPAERYQTASEFAADIQRHLRGEPIIARPPTAIEAAIKFARRHKAFVLAAVVTTLALVVGMIGTTTFAYVAAAEREQARWESYRSAVSAAASAIEADDFATAQTMLDATPEEFRGWEHDHLRWRMEPWLLEFEGSQDARSTPCVTADESRVWSVLKDGRIGVWKIANGERIDTVDPGTHAVSLSRSGTGDLFAAVGEDGRVVVLSPDTGAVLRTFQTDIPGTVLGVQLAAAASRAVVWTFEEAVVLDTRDGAEIWRGPLGDIRKGSTKQTAAALSPDGMRLAMVLDRVVIVFDLSGQGETLDRRLQDVGPSIAFTEDGRIVVGSRQRAVYLLSPTLETEGRWTGHRSDTIVDVSPYSQDRIISIDAQMRVPEGADRKINRTIRIWDMRRGRELDVLVMPPGPGDARLAPLRDDRLISGGAEDTPMLLWAFDPLGKTLLGEHKSYAYDLAWSGDSRYLASRPFVHESGNARVWDVSSRSAVASLPMRANIRYAPLAFSRDGSHLFVGTDVSADDEPLSEIWNVGTWSRAESQLMVPAVVERAGTDGLRLHRGEGWSADGSIHALIDHDPGAVSGTAYLETEGRRVALADEVRTLAVSRDGRFVCFTQGRQFSVYDVKNGALVTHQTIPLMPRAVAFSPDGSRLAIVGFSPAVHLYDTVRWEPALELRGHTATIHDVQFSPDGRWLATASSDTTVRIWGISED